MAPSERTIGQLVTDAVGDVQSIVEHEKALAKAELAAAARAGGIGAGLVAAAVSLLGLSVIYLLVAAAQGLVAAGLEPWAAYLIVGGALIVLALLLAAVGAALLRQVRGPKRAVASGQGAIEEVRSAVARARATAGAGAAAGAAAPDGATPQPPRA